MSNEKKSKKNDPSQLIDRVSELTAQVEELTEALQRERADVINIRRRYDEQMSGLKAMVKAQIIRELLPAIDNLERALAHIPKDLKAHDYVKGVQSIAKQFEKTLHSLGVIKIKTIGEPFDPRLHEAVSMDGDGQGPEIISEELQPGYVLDDEVLRHAMVRVKISG